MHIDVINCGINKRRNPNNLYQHSPLEEVEYNSPSSLRGYPWRLPGMGTVWIGSKGSMTAERPANSVPARWELSMRDKGCWWHVLLTGCVEKDPWPLWSSAPKPIPESDPRNNIWQSQSEGPSTECLTTSPQNCQGHRKQERSERSLQGYGGWMQCGVLGGRLLKKKKAPKENQ